MSTRTGYQRSGEFGASRASIKAGLSYEKKVRLKLREILTERANNDRQGWYMTTQMERNGGRVDFGLYPADKSSMYLVEVKSQWSRDAHEQLLRYGGKELPYVSRICICKVYHPHIPIPEPVTCLSLPNLLDAPTGKLTIIPWSGR